MKLLELHPEADAEMRAAARWYHACQPGLGTRFLREAARTGKLIASHPEAWPIVSGTVRRCLVAERFINNLVGSTISDANRSWAIGWVAGILNSGTTRGEVIWTAVSALASVPTSNPDWGAAVTQLNNKVSVSYYYAVTKAVSSTDLATLHS